MGRAHWSRPGRRLLLPAGTSTTSPPGRHVDATSCARAVEPSAAWCHPTRQFRVGSARARTPIAPGSAPPPPGRHVDATSCARSVEPAGRAEASDSGRSLVVRLSAQPRVPPARASEDPSARRSRACPPIRARARRDGCKEAPEGSAEAGSRPPHKTPCVNLLVARSSSGGLKMGLRGAMKRRVVGRVGLPAAP
jgi:hypothetical protein